MKTLLNNVFHQVNICKEQNKIYDDIVYLSLAMYNFAFTSICNQNALCFLGYIT